MRAACRIITPWATLSFFWQDESYDQVGAGQFARIASYIEDKPVTAGLAMAREQFRWSIVWPIINRPQVTNPPHNTVQMQKLKLSASADSLDKMRSDMRRYAHAV
jgi:hypothetical protein